MNWSDVDLSAYLDGQLTEARRVALEQALAQDAALRARLEALQHTVTLMRAAPLHEVPRNFLLTPSMVAAPRRHVAAQRWYPITRLATALTALALVITLGLQAWPMALPASAPANDRAAWDVSGAPKMVPQGTTEPTAGEVTLLTVPETTTETLRAAPPVMSPSPEPMAPSTLQTMDNETPVANAAPGMAAAQSPEESVQPMNAPEPTLMPERWIGALSAALAVLTLMFGGVTLWLGKQR